MARGSSPRPRSEPRERAGTLSRSTPLFRAARFGAVVLLACFAALAPDARAAGEPVDLGEGLSYLRVHSVGDSAAALLAAIAAERATIVDLRYASSSPDDIAKFRTALSQRKSRAALLILVSPQSPPALEGALRSLPPGAVTLGVAGSRPAPAVVVAQAAEVDRRAYDALETGTKLENLVTGKIEKERFDEASLVKEFKNGNTNAAPPPSPDPTEKPADEKSPALIDRVLQRAIHLHRALAALRPRG